MMLRTISFLALLSFSSGCFWFTTKHEGKELRKDLDRVDAQLDSQQASVKGKVAELQTVLDKATKLLTRNSADIGAEVDELERDNTKLRGLVMEAKRLTEAVAAAAKEQRERLDSLETRLTALETKSAAEPAKSASELLAEGRKHFDAKRYDKARALFKTVVVRHSTSSVAPEAQYYRGEARFRQKDFKSAIGEFQKVFDKYPKSRRADEALYRAGESAESLKWCTDARAYFGVLVKRYPRSSLVKRAKKKLTKLKKNSRNKKVCRS